MRPYNRVDFIEREELSRYLAADLSYRDIALILNRHVSTISREVKKRSLNRFEYRAVAAQVHRVQRASKLRRKRKLDTNLALQQIVLGFLKLRWSPEQIAKRLKLLYPGDMEMHVSHETIYAYLYVRPRGTLKRQMIANLRRKHKRRTTRDKQGKKCTPIQDYISIEERPPEVAARTIAGHWEGDLIMGPYNKSGLGTLVERKTRYTLLVRLSKKDAVSVRTEFTRKFNDLPSTIKKSLTYDQGHEMAEHKQFTKETKIQVYFAHPHSPWERGTSENTNMLIRDFFPKGTDFSKISENEINKVQELLNNRPRKVLDFYTPTEVFTKTVALGT